MKFDRYDWQHQAVKAINTLPKEFRDAVGYSHPRGEDFTITIACESLSGAEADIKTLRMRGGRPHRTEHSVSRPAYVEILSPDDEEGVFLSAVNPAEFRRTLQVRIAEIIGDHASKELAALPQASREVSIDDLRELEAKQEDPEAARLIGEMIAIRLELEDMGDGPIEDSPERLALCQRMLDVAAALARYMN